MLLALGRVIVSWLFTVIVLESLFEGAPYVLDGVRVRGSRWPSHDPHVRPSNAS